MAIIEQDTDGTARHWWHPSRWRLSSWGLATSTIATVMGAVALLAVSWWILWHVIGTDLEETDKSTTLLDSARTAVTLLGVLTVGGAAAVAYRRQRTLEQQHQIDEERSQLEKIKETRAGHADLHARYQQAAAQLGHEEPIIRIAGVYALEALAIEWDKTGNTIQRNVCIDLLCGYLRSTRGIISPDQDPAHPILDPPTMLETENDVRSTIAAVIGRHLKDPTGSDGIGEWSDRSYDFSGAHFYAANFEGTQWLAVDFRNAHFYGDAIFKNAQFYHEAEFEGAHFDAAADFSRAQFDEDAQFSGVRFGRATFVDSNFWASAHFSNAQFSMALFTNSRFSSAMFDNTRFYRAWFGGAQFHEAVTFVGSRFYGSSDFKNTQFHTYARFDVVQFRGYAAFDGAQFYAHATFSGAHFHSDARFSEAQFHGGVEFCEVHLHGYFDIKRGSGSLDLQDALVIPEYLTTALRQLGVTELLESVDCDECQERFATG